MIVRNISGISSIIKLLRDELYVAYDIETTGLNVRKDKIIGIALAGKDWQCYVSLKEWDGSSLVENIDAGSLSDLFVSLKRKRLIMHNASFDCRFTAHYLKQNLINSLHADTMLLAHTIDENKQPYALKELGKLFFGEQSADAQKEMLDSIKANGGHDKEYYKASLETMGKYAMQDAKLTLDIFNLLEPQLLKEGLKKFFYDDEVMPLYKEVTIPMEQRGIPLNMNLLQTSKAEIVSELERLEKEIQEEIFPLLDLFQDWYINKHYPFKLTGRFKQKLAQKFAPENWPKTRSGGYSFSKADLERAIKKGLIQPNTQLQRWAQDGEVSERIPANIIREIQLELLAEDGVKYPFNLLSKDHLKRLFFTKLKEEPLSKTDKGNPQVDDDFLDKMAEKYKWASKLRILNRLTKIKGTYIDQYMDEQEDGIFYPQFSQHRTVSGRYSSDMQQLPRKLEPGQADDIIIKFNNRVRDFFVAGDGHRLIGDDYESLEPRVFSHVSGDQGLIGIFEKGHDFYSTIAIDTEKLYEYSPDKKADNYLGKQNKAKRQMAKEYCLGIPYGKSAYALALSLDIHEQEAEKLWQAYLNAYPNLKAWMHSSMLFAIKNGYVKTQTGRIRHMPELPEIIAKYGMRILNPLDVWKEYGSDKAVYMKMKDLHKRAKNYVNNSRNFQIQGLAASIVNRAAIAMSRRFKQLSLDAYVCMQIHDELVIRCRAEDANAVASIVQDCMENTTKLSLKLIAEPCIADVYGDTK